MHDYLLIANAILSALCGAITLIWMMWNLFASIRHDGAVSLFEPRNYVRRSLDVLLKPFLFFLASSIVIWILFSGARLLFAPGATP